MKSALRKGLGLFAAALCVGPFLAPELLAFPHQQDFGTDRVWSTQPIPHKQMAAVLADANGRVAASPLAKGTEGRRIFLTDGGWRWALLALNTSGGFALTRAARDDLIFNRTSVSQGKVFNGASMGGVRSLAGVIAHEKCHGMVRRRFGIIGDLTRPQWLSEGYCDHVARESSLSDADVARLRAEGKDHPALPYYEGRRRVAASLAANGNNVEALFDEAP